MSDLEVLLSIHLNVTAYVEDILSHPQTQHR